MSFLGWPTIAQISALAPLPDGYRHEQLMRTDVPALIVGMWSWERLPDTLAMYGRLSVIAPEHRSAKLASAVMPLAERAGRAMGAELLFGLATLKIPHMQHALESAAFQLIGFTCGYDCEEVAPGDVRRVFEGVYCKVLVHDGALLRPDPKHMTPTAKALYGLLFPD